MCCLSSTPVRYFKYNRVLRFWKILAICTFRTHGVNFTIYDLQLLASSWWIYKYPFVFLKLAVLGNERNLSPQSKEAGSWLFYYKCLYNSQQDIMNTMLPRLHFTHNLRRKWRNCIATTHQGNNRTDEWIRETGTCKTSDIDGILICHGVENWWVKHINIHHFTGGIRKQYAK